MKYSSTLALCHCFIYIYFICKKLFCKKMACVLARCCTAKDNATFTCDLVNAVILDDREEINGKV